MLLVDGMRYDYAEYLNTEYNNKYRLKSLQTLELLNNDKFFKIRAYADPPTSTAIRLRSILTGSIPNYSDLLKPFSPDKSMDNDSLPYIVKSNDMKVKIIGDHMFIEATDESHWTEEFTFNTCQFIDFNDYHIYN